MRLENKVIRSNNSCKPRGFYTLELNTHNMVYFITDGNYIKIGKADDVGQRLIQLQTGNPNKLSILYSMIGEYDLEKTIHDFYKDYRVEGEWFNIPLDNLSRFIDNIFRLESNDDVIGYINARINYKSSKVIYTSKILDYVFDTMSEGNIITSKGISINTGIGYDIVRAAVFELGITRHILKHNIIAKKSLKDSYYY